MTAAPRHPAATILDSCVMGAMQHSPGRVVFPQQRKNFGVVECVASAADDGQKLRVGAEPFQRGINLANDLHSDVDPGRGWPPAD